jgi:hypothetical protein
VLATFHGKKKNRQKPSEFSNFNFMIPRTFTPSATMSSRVTLKGPFYYPNRVDIYMLNLLFVLQELDNGY